MIGIYHNRDLDGIACGAIMKKAYPDIHLIGYDYGDPLELPEIGVPVIMADVSLPMDKMYELAKKSGWQLTWVDHHAQKIDEFRKYTESGELFCNVYLDDSKSACVILWEVLFMDIPIPATFRYLSDFDIWNNSDQARWFQTILPFQYAMRSICFNVDTFPDWAFDAKIPNVLRFIAMGEDVERYSRMQSRFKNSKWAFEANWKGYRVICRNTSEFYSDTFKGVYDIRKHDLMMVFNFNGSFFQVSIYTTKDINCAKLAAKQGGGGHPQAAGFHVKSFDQIGLTGIRKIGG